VADKPNERSASTENEEEAVWTDMGWPVASLYPEQYHISGSKKGCMSTTQRELWIHVQNLSQNLREKYPASAGSVDFLRYFVFTTDSSYW
jgi:hypothetical protein